MASTSFTIKGQNHTGITITSLDSSLEFWRGLLGGELRYRKKLELGQGANVVGLPGAVIEAAILLLPGGGIIELLEYSAPDNRTVYELRACDVGSVHVALEVTGTRALMNNAEELGWNAAVGAVDEIPKIKRGDGSEWTAIYLFGPDGETIQLLERVDMQ